MEWNPNNQKTNSPKSHPLNPWFHKSGEQRKQKLQGNQSIRSHGSEVADECTEGISHEVSSAGLVITRSDVFGWWIRNVFRSRSQSQSVIYVWWAALRNPLPRNRIPADRNSNPSSPDRYRNRYSSRSPLAFAASLKSNNAAAVTPPNLHLRRRTQHSSPVRQ